MLWYENQRLPYAEQTVWEGANNGAVINLSANGVPMVAAGVPVRYIHSMTGITTYEDFETTAALAAILAKELTLDIFSGF